MDDKCPKCGTRCEVGFGLAGGGYGAYLWCPQCEEITAKWQESDDNDSKPAEEQSHD